MLYDRKAVQENLRNKEGKRVFFLGKGHQLTSDARDWLARERIPVLPAEQATPEGYRLQNGAFLQEKPEHMTHLNAEFLVEKTHPRISFRGAVDSLEASLLLAAAECEGSIRTQLAEALAYTRYLLGQEVLEQPIDCKALGGMGEKQLRQRSHRPQDFYGKPHFMPSPEDSKALLLVNAARCKAREAELMAAKAFRDAEGLPTRPDLIRALNRLSSFLYLIMIQLKSLPLEGKVSQPAP